MRGAWRSAFLQVATAQEAEGMLQGEQQRQQQNEQQLEREPHSCVAAVSLNNGVLRTGRMTRCRQCAWLYQRVALRTDILWALSLLVEPM